MKVLVDTSVWSLAFRRRTQDLNPLEQNLVHELLNLIRDHRVHLLGPVRQELLSGIKSWEQFEKLRLVLRPFRDEPLDMEDYEAAAMASNRCRARGVAVTAVDALLCAVALRKDLPVFTTDPDFSHYSRILSLKLYPHSRTN